jgi:hypothetical protein
LDSTGHPEKNTINVRIDKARFQNIINFDPPIVRIPSLPQIRIRHLMNKGYDKRLIDR